MTKSEIQNPEKIRILYPITSLLPGGVQAYLVNLVTGLDRERFDPVVAYGLEGAPLYELKAAGVRVVKIAGLKKSISPMDDLRALINIIKLIKAENPMIIHTNMSKANLIGRLAGTICRTPLIIMTAHGWANFLRYYYKSLLKRIIQRGVEKALVPLGDHYILVSYADRERLLKLNILPPDRITVIRNGIDFRIFRNNLENSEKKQELGLSPDLPMIVMVGNLFASKAPLDYFRAAKIVLENWGPSNFILVGDGKLRPRVEEMIDGFSIRENCRVLGYRSDVPEILSAADLFLLPTLREGLSISLLEAMAAGLPIVTTDIAENRELLKEEKNGFLVSPHRPDLLAEGIMKVLNDTDMATGMGERNRKLVEDEFGVRKMVEKTQQLYLKLLDSASAGKSPTQRRWARSIGS